MIPKNGYIYIYHHIYMKIDLYMVVRYESTRHKKKTINDDISPDCG